MKFHELNDKQKDKVRYSDTLAPHDGWWDFIYEDAIEKGVALGFHIERINFSGFYSQGDGASWVGSVDIVPWLEHHKPKCAKAIILRELIEAPAKWVSSITGINRSYSNYCHENTMYGGTLDYADPEHEKGVLIGGTGMLARVPYSELAENCRLVEDYFPELAEEILESAKDYARDIYKRLQDEYDYMSSDEYLAELCEANEYEFDEEGQLV